jgi:hypothetical protein
MEEEKDIFDLSVAKDEDKFVKKSLKLESEVVSDILEQMKVFPWLGSLIKLGMVGKGFLDLRFVRKIGRFLQPSNDIAQERKEAFLDKLDKKDRKRMYEYLMHLLYTAEEDKKADVMGKVYRDRIIGNIDNDIFLRLCSAINKVYIDDVDRLGDYTNPNPKDDYVTNNLYSSGLLQTTESKFEGSALVMGGSYVLNDLGRHLLRILK